MEGQSSNRSRLIFLGALAAAGIVALIIVLIAAGGDDSGGDSGSASASGGCEDVSTPAAKDVKLSRPPLDPPPAGTKATVDTNCGSFVIALDTEQAPKTSASFAYMADQGAYDDTSFLRIVPDFVIQGGDPTGTQSGNAGYTVEEAPPSGVQYSEGVVAMAKSGAEPAGTSGSQFFVVIGPGASSLPPDYALLGKVDSGMDVVQRIAAIGTAPGSEKPASPVVIKTITIAS